jgi:hypothetical protein
MEEGRWKKADVSVGSLQCITLAGTESTTKQSNRAKGIRR